MSEEITEAITKLEMYRDQIEEQTKKEILEMVLTYDENYFQSISKDEIDKKIEHISNRFKTLKSLRDMVTFLEINYDPEFKKKLIKDLKNSLVLSFSSTSETWGRGINDPLSDLRNLAREMENRPIVECYKDIREELEDLRKKIKK